MREIKFRAFDHVDCVMLFADIYEMQDIQGEWTAWDLPSDSPTNTGTPFDIMQFTGFQDKNGVDIFEGDVVKETRLLHFGKSTLNKQVEFRGSSFKIGDLVISKYMGIDWEVIGNIYQNPELINNNL